MALPEAMESRRTTWNGSILDALTAFVTGVTIVITEDDEGTRAMTATAFSLASLHPPFVALSIAATATTARRLADGSPFSVNILASDQRPLADRFSGAHRHMAEPFKGIALTRGRVGVPRLKRCVASIECVAQGTLSCGDHVIVVGRVLHVDLGEASSPLIQYRHKLIGLDDPGVQCSE
jgi:flavin reductase (DIM6/NTAB) family NADH-FMN oxidoreductase RutF